MNFEQGHYGRTPMKKTRFIVWFALMAGVAFGGAYEKNGVFTVSLPDIPFQALRLQLDKINKSPQACLDELEVFDGAGRNLATNGAVKVSGSLQGYAIHKPEHLTDGKFGNDHSWVADRMPCSVTIEWQQPVKAKTMQFSRDRTGRLTDRIPTGFRVDALIGGAWQEIARFPDSAPDAAYWQRRLAVEFNPPAFERAVKDLFNGAAQAAILKEATRYRQMADEASRLFGSANETDCHRAIATAQEILAYKKKILLRNPVLDFDELLLLKRRFPSENNKAATKHPEYWRWGLKYGFTVNWSSDYRMFDFGPLTPPDWGWQDAFVIRPLRDNAPADERAVYTPSPGRTLLQPELHFDAKRFAFAAPGTNNNFQVYEMNLDGTGLRQVTRDIGADVDNGDPCYLPDGRILFTSSRGFNAVPCHDGMVWSDGLCVVNADGSNEKMLTFDQMSNWHPSLLHDGRVMYTRFEYGNYSHQYGRLLFTMNPDGTKQTALYGSNSYWPNSIFYARAVPGNPSMVAGIVCGHHGPSKYGKLILFDPSKGRNNADGVVQAVPGFGKKVEPIITDQLYEKEYPKFAFPWPLDEKTLIVSGRLAPEQKTLGVYLVDIYDNITEIASSGDYSYLEPIPVKKRPVPPAIPDMTDPDDKEATLFVQDIYTGPGLKGVPRGAVKQVRIFTYDYYYRNQQDKWRFGHLATAGIDGPWEPRCLLGTVPVHEDGSVLCKVPANTPVSLQPLDADGKALQLMRSWLTARPGEMVSCVGCHEQASETTGHSKPGNGYGTPDHIQNLFGPPRGYDFAVEIQPLLDRSCVGCHNSSQSGRPDLSRKTEEEKVRSNAEYYKKTGSGIKVPFPPAFLALHAYVRRAGAESCYFLQEPGNWTADTSPLIQLLKKGHHGVRLGDDDWKQLYTWIDLNAPGQGSWNFSPWKIPFNQYERRLEMYAKYGNRTFDVEKIPPVPGPVPYVAPAAVPPSGSVPAVKGWPFSPEEAQRLQAQAGSKKTVTVEVAPGHHLTFVLIPAGTYATGNPGGPEDERVGRVVTIERPFYMCTEEISNEIYNDLMPGHDSGYESNRSIDNREAGFPLFEPQQPVVRVSQDEARAFCRKLGEKAGVAATLPTEEQWEWACRAGSARPFWYGDEKTDFSPYANLADKSIEKFRFLYQKPDWYLRDERFDDGAQVSAPVGSYAPNPWGLRNMHGNVAEWTRSEYVKTPGDAPLKNSYVVRGGSWDDRPQNATATTRWCYPAWRKVYNVGFRVIVEISEKNAPANFQ
ncbi:MAG: hypothetical protein EPN23_08270 [Verrucomicrobia bacterium]|nr:MAG: hypothetical protein EPN23_08270 [Verrucomicrobiota bacterium]